MVFIPVGIDIFQALTMVFHQLIKWSCLSSGIRGVLICSSGFTSDAVSFAKDRGLALWDRHHLFELSGVSPIDILIALL